MSSYYKVSHILFIYLVGRACIPGIFGWFVLLFCFLCVCFFGLCNIFFSFLKRPDHPGGDHLPLGDKPAVISLPEPSLLWAPSEFLQTQSWSGFFKKARLPISQSTGGSTGCRGTPLGAALVCRRNGRGCGVAHEFALKGDSCIHQL